MIGLKNLLIPTDLSEHTTHAVDYARELASAYDARLHLLHVLDYTWARPPAVSLTGNAFVESAIVGYEQERKKELDALRRSIEGVEALDAMMRGEPHVAIVRYAREHGIDLIVMATHGRAGLSHVLIGSVARKVVQMAPCPVLTVKHPQHEFALP